MDTELTLLIETQETSLEVNTGDDLVVTINDSANVALDVLEENAYVLEIAAASPGSELPPVTLQAGASISAYRAVYVGTDGKIYLLSSNDSANAHAFIGFTKQAVVTDQHTELHVGGVVENNSWSFEPNDAIFIDNMGRASNIPPTNGVNLFVGFAISTTKIFLQTADITIL
jgi:hypothetical protein